MKLVKAALLPPFEGGCPIPAEILMRLEFQVDPKAEAGARSLEGTLTLVDRGGKEITQEVKFPLTVLAAGEKPEVLNQKMLDALNVFAEMQGRGRDPCGSLCGTGGRGRPVRREITVASARPGAGRRSGAQPHALRLSFDTHNGKFLRGPLPGEPDPDHGPHALLYWAGMVITYTLLGAVISVSGQMLGQALTSPGVTVFNRAGDSGHGQFHVSACGKSACPPR